MRRIRDHGKKLGADPRLGTELGRLLMLEEITAAEAAAGFKLAEIYGRYGYYHGRKRTAKSPAYESGFRAAANWESNEEDDDYIARYNAAIKTFESLPIQAKGFSASQRSAIERLCVEDESLAWESLQHTRAWLAFLAEHFGTVKASKKQPIVKKIAKPKDNPLEKTKSHTERDRESWLYVVKQIRPDLPDDEALHYLGIYRAMAARSEFRQRRAERTNYPRLAVSNY